MSALYDLFLMIEEHQLYRSHGTLNIEARNEYVKMIQDIETLSKENERLKEENLQESLAQLIQVKDNNVLYGKLKEANEDAERLAELCDITMRILAEEYEGEWVRMVEKLEVALDLHEKRRKNDDNKLAT